MKKIVLVSVIFSLILFTAIIKNTTKQIEDELFTCLLYTSPSPRD